MVINCYHHRLLIQSGGGTTLDVILENLKPIAQATLTEGSSELTLDGLDLEPGIYKIYVAEWSTTSTPGGHFIGLNDITDNYSGTLIFNLGDTLSMTNNVNKGIALTNGWDVGTPLVHTEITLFYFNKDWINVQATMTTKGLTVIENCWCLTKLNTINKISIMTINSDLIGAGSYIKLYKLN